MDSLDIIFQLQASMQELVAPWKVFVGLVELCPSKYCEPGNGYTIDASRVEFLDKRQCVIVHPDDVPLIKNKLALKTDAEVAAYLWWVIQNRP